MQTQDTICKIQDLLFFDDQALRYLVNQAPTSLIVASFSIIDDRLFSCLLRNKSREQRRHILQKIQATFIKQNQLDKTNKHEIEQAFIILANDLYQRGLIMKKGCHFLGKVKK